MHAREVNMAVAATELCGLIRHDDNDQLSFRSLTAPPPPHPPSVASLPLHATLIGASERDHRKRPVPSPPLALPVATATVVFARDVDT